MADIALNLNDVKDRLKSSAEAADRNAADVELIAVSKTFDAEAIEPALMAGHRVFGENRVQESQKKWPYLKEKYSCVELHLIGPLQSNKSADAVELFDVIQTVDRDKIARTLADEVQKQARAVKFFIQVNTGEEPQKAGILPANADAFIQKCRETYGLDVLGLMCIPPVEEVPALHFAFLEKIAKRNGLEALSMGMSSDYETAVKFGATHVRVGSAIFGARDYPVSA